MAKRMDVGTSWHTRAKHSLMREFIAKEVRAANSLGWFERLSWIDLTAGNGVPAYGCDWYETCSPGILARHAATSRKPVMVHLYEKNSATYGELLSQLESHLPHIGYSRSGESQWQIERRIILRVFNADGRTATLDHLSRKDAVLVLNDPNAITEWAMRPTFAAEIDARAKGLRIMSTLGCNVCGIKRAPFQKEGAEPLSDEPELMSLTERRNWFRLISGQEEALPQRHDMLLASFARDSSQWAYLMSTPETWWSETEDEVLSAFSDPDVGHAAEMAWFRRDSARFEKTKERLFLTKAELRDRDNPALPFGLPDEQEGAA